MINLNAETGSVGNVNNAICMLKWFGDDCLSKRVFSPIKFQNGF